MHGILAGLFLLFSSSLLAQPTLLPSSGVIAPVGQVFTYQANGVPVERFTIWIGTETSGPNRRNIVDTGNLGPSDNTFTAPFLPNGTVYVRLRYFAAGTWTSVENSYTVSDDASTAAALLSELACDIGELIKTTATSWECVDSDELAGPDYAGELCDLYIGGGLRPPSSLVCPQPSERYVFVTKSLHDADFGGFSSADATCQAEADDASLEGTYRAFLSIGFSGGTSRIRTIEGAPFKTPDGKVVANNVGQLIDGQLTNPINRHADNTTPSGTTSVWTGGNRLDESFSCNGWTSTTTIAGGAFIFHQGARGNMNSQGDDWAYNDSLTSTGNRCSNAYRLYCFEN